MAEPQVSESLLDRVRKQRALQQRDQWLRGVGGATALADVRRGASVTDALRANMPQYATPEQERAAQADLKMKYIDKIAEVEAAKKARDDALAATEKEVVTQQRTALETLVKELSAMSQQQAQASAQVASSKVSAAATLAGIYDKRAAPAPALDADTAAAVSLISGALPTVFNAQTGSSGTRAGATPTVAAATGDMITIWDKIKEQVDQGMKPDQAYQLLSALDNAAGWTGTNNSLVNAVVNYDPQNAADLLAGQSGAAIDAGTLAALSAVQTAVGAGVRQKAAEIADAAHQSQQTDKFSALSMKQGPSGQSATQAAIVQLTAAAGGLKKPLDEKEWYDLITTATSSISKENPDLSALIQQRATPIVTQTPAKEDADAAVDAHFGKADPYDKLLDTLYDQLDEVGAGFQNLDPQAERAAIMGSKGFADFMQKNGIQDPDYAWAQLKKFQGRDAATLRQADRVQAEALGMGGVSTLGTTAELPLGAKPLDGSPEDAAAELSDPSDDFDSAAYPGTPGIRSADAAVGSAMNLGALSGAPDQPPSEPVVPITAAADTSTLRSEFRGEQAAEPDAATPRTAAPATAGSGFPIDQNALNRQALRNLLSRRG